MSIYAIDDLRSAFRNLGGWSYLAAKRIQLENRRTLIGTTWVVLSFGIVATGIGALMSQLQNRPMDEHVTYVVFSFAIWNFIQNSVVAGCNVMVTAKPYLLQMRTARTVFPLSLTLRNLYLLGLNLLTAAVVAAVFGWRPGAEALWAIPALSLLVLLGFFASVFLGIVCARLRDLTRLVEAIMRFAFFFTPVIWVAGTRDAAASGLLSLLMTWNPLAYLISAMRDGMLGARPEAIDWYVMAGLTAAAAVCAFAALQFMGRRVTYWL